MRGHDVPCSPQKAVYQLINTVTGSAEAGDLGLVLMHEHVVTRSPGIAEAFPDTYPRQEIADHCVSVLSRLKSECGVQTLVDHTTIELGRDPQLLKEISSRSGMQIIASTGVWAQPAAYYQHRSPEESASLFIREVETGMAGSGVRAGIVKCAIDDAGLSQIIERTIRAAALTHRATGVPITVHTSCNNRSGLLAARILQAENVDMRHVVIGHSGDTEDMQYLHDLLETGAWLGMDRFGIEDRLPDSKRVRLVSQLCAEGYADRLLLSHDASCWSGRLTTAYKASVRPNWHYWRLFEFVIPALKADGVGQAAIDTMLRANPRNFFGRTAEC